jgi:hypothetical protein
MEFEEEVGVTDPGSSSGAGQKPPPELASPTCYQAELDASAPTMERAELIALLNTLIEGERAGARALSGMQSEVADPAGASLLHDVAKDEGRFCAMLSHHVERLGGQPSRKTGVFLDKLEARDSLSAKLSLLDRGQSAVVRMLDLALPEIADPRLQADLVEMRDVHVRNIERCAAYAGLEGHDSTG